MNKKEAYFVFLSVLLGVVGSISLFVYALKHTPTLERPKRTEKISRTQSSFTTHASNTTVMDSMSSVERGEKLVSINCSVCHNADAKGKVGLAPSIRNKDFLAVASNDFIKRTIRLGRPGTSMVARPDLRENQVNDIINYLRDLEVAIPVNIKIDHSKKYQGDVLKGQSMFRTYCSPCHGVTGEGYIAGGSGPGIGKSGFLNVASDDFIFQTVKHGRVGTAMRSFLGAGGLANLTEQDIADIVVFLRSLKD